MTKRSKKKTSVAAKKGTREKRVPKKSVKSKNRKPSIPAWLRPTKKAPRLPKKSKKPLREEKRGGGAFGAWEREWRKAEEKKKRRKTKTVLGQFAKKRKKGGKKGSRKEIRESVPTIEVVDPVFFGPKTEWETRIEFIENLKTLPLGMLSESQHNFFMTYTKRNGRVAKHPSSLRWYAEADDLIERLWETGGDPLTDEFEEVANEIAEEFEVGVNEVFTLFMSH